MVGKMEIQVAVEGGVKDAKIGDKKREAGILVMSVSCLFSSGMGKTSSNPSLCKWSSYLLISGIRVRLSLLLL